MNIKLKVKMRNYKPDLERSDEVYKFSAYV